MTQVLEELVTNLGFHMSPVFGQLQLRNCPKMGDYVRQEKLDHLVPAMRA